MQGEGQGGAGREAGQFVLSFEDFLWLVVRLLEGVRVVMVQLASVGINQIEAVLNFRRGNYFDQQGDQKVRVNPDLPHSQFPRQCSSTSTTMGQS